MIKDRPHVRSDRVEAATEQSSPEWGERALGHLRRVATLRPHFTGEDIKRAAYEAGLERPANESAWGPVMSKAKRQRWIEFIGFAAPQSASRHGSPNRKWKSLIVEGL